MVSESDMPHAVNQFFKAFINGLEVPSKGAVFKSQWKVFIDKLRLVNQKKLIEEVDDWLMFQS